MDYEPYRWRHSLFVLCMQRTEDVWDELWLPRGLLTSLPQIREELMPVVCEEHIGNIEKAVFNCLEVIDSYSSDLCSALMEWTNQVYSYSAGDRQQEGIWHATLLNLYDNDTGSFDPIVVDAVRKCAVSLRKRSAAVVERMKPHGNWIRGDNDIAIARSLGMALDKMPSQLKVTIAANIFCHSWAICMNNLSTGDLERLYFGAKTRSVSMGYADGQIGFPGCWALASSAAWRLRHQTCQDDVS